MPHKKKSHPKVAAIRTGLPPEWAISPPRPLAINSTDFYLQLSPGSPPGRTHRVAQQVLQKRLWCPASGLALRPHATRCVREAAAGSVTITVGVQPTTSALAYTTKKKSEPRPACHDLDRASRLDYQLVDGPLQFCTPALFLGGPGVPTGISARRHLDRRRPSTRCRRSVSSLYKCFFRASSTLEWSLRSNWCWWWGCETPRHT